VDYLWGLVLWVGEYFWKGEIMERRHFFLILF